LRKWSGFGFTLVAIIVLAFHMWQFGDYIADDAAITFSYARNLAVGHGLVLTPGTDPVEGYSNFGWLLLVLPFCATGADPTWPIKGLSLVLGGLTLGCMSVAARHLFADSRVGGHEWLRGLAGVGLAAFTPYAVWAGSGMETPLYCLLIVLSLYCYATRSWIGCAAALVGLSLTRFEGLAVAAIFILHRVGVIVFEWRKPTRGELYGALTFLAVYGLYASWHWWYFRAFFPNTYLAKAPALDFSGATSQLLDFQAGGWNYVRSLLLEKYRFSFVGLLALVPLVVSGWAMGSLLAFVLAGLVGLTVLTGGDFYPEFRLGAGILPVAFLLLAEGGRIAVSRLRLAPLAMVLACIPIALVCQPSLAATPGFGDPISMRGMKRDRADRYVNFARDVGKSRLTVLEADIGAVAYFTGFPILDISGLANLHVARFGYSAPFFLHYVFEEAKPDLIHLQSVWARNANVPRSVIGRDYVQLDLPIAVPYAEGYYLRKDLYAATLERKRRQEPADLLPAAIAAADASLKKPSHEGIIEIFWQVNQLCTERETWCTEGSSLSRRAQSSAERERSQTHFAEAFDLYASAALADPGNLAALMGREDMRLASVDPAEMLRTGRAAELPRYFRHKLAMNPKLSRSDLLTLARTVRLGTWVDAKFLRNLTRPEERPELLEGWDLLRLQLEPTSVYARQTSERLLREPRGVAVTARVGDVATLEGYTAQEVDQGRVEIVTYFRPLRDWTTHRIWVHAYPAGSQSYVDLGPELPTVATWQVGELAWELFRTPANGSFTLYMGVATGDDLGPAQLLGSVGRSAPGR